MRGTRRARRRLVVTATAIATGTPALGVITAGSASVGGAIPTTRTDPPVTVTVPPVPGVPLPTVETPVVSVVPAPTSPPGATAPEEESGARPDPGSDGSATGLVQQPSAGVQGRVPATRPGAAGRPAGTRSHRRRRVVRLARPGFAVDGTPTPANPTFSYALPGAAPIGVPNFFIDKFRIPPFLLPIYQAAGIEYGVRWEILAAINEIETDYGRNLNISSAGAQGWMQFMPATWKSYGLDANRDGTKDPYNPVDAIFAAARYLRAAGAETDIRAAIFAYNHADWYVDSVLMRARLIGGTPADLIGSLTGLTQGRFPVAAPARYAKGRSATNIFARSGAAVVAVQDATVTRIARTRKLGRYVRVRDAYGNSYTYARLGSVARTYALPARRKESADPADTSRSPLITQSIQQVAAALSSIGAQAPSAPLKERLFAHPERHADLVLAGPAAEGGGELRRLRVGSRVAGGTVLGRIGAVTEGVAPHVRFSIRPAGRGAPLIDPKPILDGWKLLESTAIYRARGRNPLFGPDARNPTIGQIMLMSKAQLMRRVLADRRITIYPGGRGDIRSGQIDRRVLATLALLSASGLKPTVSSLKGNHGLYTASGNISEHSTGNAVDIAEINGLPILGHQGAGSITDLAIRRLLTLQGVMRPHQIISLMAVAGADNTLALPDHADHIHVGFRAGGSDPGIVLKPLQWTRLIDRLGRIDNPTLEGGER